MGKYANHYFHFKWWETYSKDTIKRLDEFDKLRTDTFNIA